MAAAVASCGAGRALTSAKDPIVPAKHRRLASGAALLGATPTAPLSWVRSCRVMVTMLCSPTARPRVALRALPRQVCVPLLTPASLCRGRTSGESQKRAQHDAIACRRYRCAPRTAAGAFCCRVLSLFLLQNPELASHDFATKASSLGAPPSCLRLQLARR